MSEPHKVSISNWIAGIPTKDGTYWLARPMIGLVVKFLGYDRWQYVNNGLPGITHYMEIEYPEDI